MRIYLAAGAVLLAAFSLTFALSPWDDELVSDLPLYRGYADFFLDGVLPYRDIAFEYPPLAAPLMALPGLGSLDLDSYRVLFAALSLALLAALALATAALARRGETSDPSGVQTRSTSRWGTRERALFAVAAAPLATGAMVRTHFDLAPVLCLVAGLAAIAASRTRLGFAAIGIGGALKLFPLIAVPATLMWLCGRGERRAALEGLAVTAAVVALAAAGAAALSPEGAWNAVEYHIERPIQIESLPASVLNAVDAAGGRAPSAVHSHQSDGLEHPAADALAAVFLGLLAAAVAAFTLIARRLDDIRGLVLTGLGATAAFATFGKVLSPQFMIWLVPLAALAFAWRMHALAVVATATVAATLAWFPERYFDLVDRDVGPLVAVGVRNALLVATLALVARELLRESAGAARSTPPGRPAALRSAPR